MGSLFDEILAKAAIRGFTLFNNQKQISRVLPFNRDNGTSSGVPLVLKRDEPCCFFCPFNIFFTDVFLVNGSTASFFSWPEVAPCTGIVLPLCLICRKRNTLSGVLIQRGDTLAAKSELKLVN